MPRVANSRSSLSLLVLLLQHTRRNCVTAIRLRTGKWRRHYPWLRQCICVTKYFFSFYWFNYLDLTEWRWSAASLRHLSPTIKKSNYHIWLGLRCAKRCISVCPLFASCCPICARPYNVNWSRVLRVHRKRGFLLNARQHIQSATSNVSEKQVDLRESCDWTYPAHSQVHHHVPYNGLVCVLSSLAFFTRGVRVRQHGSFILHDYTHSNIARSLRASFLPRFVVREILASFHILLEG